MSEKLEEALSMAGCCCWLLEDLPLEGERSRSREKRTRPSSSLSLPASSSWSKVMGGESGGWEVQRLLEESWC